MPKLLSDHDVEGQLHVLLTVWTSPDWIELWQWLNCRIATFAGLGLSADMTDVELWKYRHAPPFVLLTGNRNAESAESLEIASQRLNQANSLPVLTIADTDRIMADRRYAQAVASRIVDFLVDLERFRGSRRLYVP